MNSLATTIAWLLLAGCTEPCDTSQDTHSAEPAQAIVAVHPGIVELTVGEIAFVEVINLDPDYQEVWLEPAEVSIAAAVEVEGPSPINLVVSSLIRLTLVDEVPEHLEGLLTVGVLGDDPLYVKVVALAATED